MATFHHPCISIPQEQDNTWTRSWKDFWADRRIGDLVRRSGDTELLKLEEQLREKVYPLLFNDQAMKNVRPAIIHGDLWSGNSGTDDNNGQPIIFDPSSSYCHNEAELGIMKMFGGYSNEFFEAYHSVIPKAEPFYDQRIEMYEAFHHLNHFVIFGGGYRYGTVRIFKKLIAWADEQIAKGNNGSSDDNDNDGGDDGSSDSRKKRGLRGGGGTVANLSQVEQNINVHQDRNAGRSPPSPSMGNASLAGQHSARSPASENTALDHSIRGNIKSAIVPTPAQISDFFSQMICYIWFSTGLPTQTRPSTPARSPTNVHMPLQSSPLAPRRYMPNGSVLPWNGQKSHAKMASTSALPSFNDQEISKSMQDHLISSSTASNSGINHKSIGSDSVMQRLQPKGRFLRFTRELLGTTQLSTSVITLALIYVYRLKVRHPHLRGREGSEYRVAISALMLANKILDDNTYLNKTWAEISGMPLIEISKMEVEFWLGLKMEMHIGKHEYDLGLHELQLLSNDRARLIREREAFLKNMAFQQQQAQQKKMLTTPYHFPSYPFQDQDYPSKSRQFTQYSFNQPNLDIQQHDWQSISGATAIQKHPMSSPCKQIYHQPQAARHSIGNGELFQNQASWSSNSHIRQISPQSTVAHSVLNQLSPQQRQTPYTMPSSPLSQESAVPSIATASNDALACFSEVEASTPQDMMPFYAMEQIQMMPTIDGSNNTAYSLQAQMPFTEHQQQQQMGGEIFQSTNIQPFEPLHNRSKASSCQPHFQQQVTMPQGSFSSTRPTSAQTDLMSGLKREFEKAKYGSTSPQDIRATKRFAFDSNVHEGNRMRRCRISSAGFQSPSDRGQSMFTQRPMSSSSPFLHQLEQHPQRLNASVSPSNFIQSARLASPSSLATLPVEVHGFTASPFVTESEVVTTNVMVTANHSLADRTFAELGQMASERFGNHHSVFSSALTPNSLAAPLQFANGSWPIVQRDRVPLRYYSLAAGEARGNLGQYFPSHSPAIDMANNHHNRILTSGSGVSYGVQNPGFASHHGTPFNSALNSELLQSNPMRTAETHQASSSSYDTHIGTTKFTGQQPCFTMATTTPVSEFGIHQEQYPLGIDYMNARSGVDIEQNLVNSHQSRLSNKAYNPPPFALDPQGWPLANSSTANSFLFPYHLLPTVDSQTQS